MGEPAARCVGIEEMCRDLICTLRLHGENRGRSGAAGKGSYRRSQTVQVMSNTWIILLAAPCSVHGPLVSF